MSKTDKIKELNIKRGKNRKKDVLNIINRMKVRGDKISFYSVAKATGASRSYLYNNLEIKNAIEGCRGVKVQSRTKESNKVIIIAQQKKIEELNKMIKKLEEENSDSYKKKYERLMAENKELKKQIKNATYYI